MDVKYTLILSQDELMGLKLISINKGLSKDAIIMQLKTFVNRLEKDYSEAAAPNTHIFDNPA